MDIMKVLMRFTEMLLEKTIKYKEDAKLLDPKTDGTKIKLYVAVSLAMLEVHQCIFESIKEVFGENKG